MKIATIVGARPNFMKLGPLSKILRVKHQEIIIHTGQHYDSELSHSFFSDLGIPEPDYNLGVGSASHGKQTAKMLEKIEDVLLIEKPDFVIVFGDTNSGLAGALATRKLGVSLAHIEAGMRNFDWNKPEEINRKIIDHISDLNFPPTEAARTNRENEGIIKNVHLVGDVTCDVLKENLSKAKKKSNIFSQLPIKKQDYLLVTCHKSTNTDNPKRLEKIITSISNLKQKIVFPIHPRTKKMLKEFKLYELIQKDNIIITEPLGYLDMLLVLDGCEKVITDSGGVQKEAFVLRKPCITLRETEWIETVKEGWNRIVDVESEDLCKIVNDFMPKKQPRNIFGQSGVSKKIVKIMEKFKV